MTSLQPVTSINEAFPHVLAAFGDFIRENRGGLITIHARKLATFYEQHPDRYPPIRVDRSGDGEEDDNGVFGVVLGKLADPVSSVIVPQLDSDGNPRKLSQAGIVYDYDPAPDIKDVDVIRISKVKPPKFTIRMVDDVTRMMGSLKNTGQAHPITVRPLKKCCDDPKHAHYEYEVVDGFTRYRSCIYLGSITRIRAQVKEMNDREAVHFMFRSNLMRYEMNDWDQGAAFQMAIGNGWADVKELAAELGYGTNYVYDRLNLMKAPDETQENVKRKVWTLKHALEVHKLVYEEVLTSHTESEIATKAAAGEIPRSLFPQVLKEYQDAKEKDRTPPPVDQAVQMARQRLSADQYSKKVSTIVIATRISKDLSCPHCGFHEMWVDWDKGEIYARQTVLEEFKPTY